MQHSPHVGISGPRDKDAFLEELSIIAIQTEFMLPRGFHVHVAVYLCICISRPFLSHVVAGFHSGPLRGLKR